MYYGDATVTGPAANPALGDPFIVSATVPAPVQIGMAWLDTTAGAIKVYDGTSWITATGGGGGGTLPAARAANDLLVSTAAGNNWAAGDFDSGRY